MFTSLVHFTKLLSGSVAMERMVIKFFLWAIIGAGFGYLFEATPAICGVIAFIFGLTGAIFGAVDAAERKQEQQKTAGNRT